MSSKWIPYFDGADYAERRDAYLRWVAALPEQLDGFTVVRPALDWQKYPIARLEPGQCFAIPFAENLNALKTCAWRARTVERTYLVRRDVCGHCVCFRLS